MNKFASAIIGVIASEALSANAIETVFLSDSQMNEESEEKVELIKPSGSVVPISSSIDQVTLYNKDDTPKQYNVGFGETAFFGEKRIEYVTTTPVPEPKTEETTTQYCTFVETVVTETGMKANREGCSKADLKGTIYTESKSTTAAKETESANVWTFGKEDKFTQSVFDNQQIESLLLGTLFEQTRLDSFLILGGHGAASADEPVMMDYPGYNKGIEVVASVSYDGDKLSTDDQKLVTIQPLVKSFFIMQSTVFDAWKKTFEDANGENAIVESQGIHSGPCDADKYESFTITVGEHFKIDLSPADYLTDTKMGENCILGVLKGNSTIGDKTVVPLRQFRGYYWQYDFQSAKFGVANSYNSTKPSVKLGAVAGLQAAAALAISSIALLAW